MTDKDHKLAEEYRKSLWQRLTDDDDFERLEMFDENVKEAYLAGLEAGRPKWHDVAGGNCAYEDYRDLFPTVDEAEHIPCDDCKRLDGQIFSDVLTTDNWKLREIEE